MQITIETLGEAISYKRGFLKISHKVLAKKLGIGDSDYIAKIESNEVIPSLYETQGLESILEFENRELLELAGYPSEDTMEILREAIKQNGEKTIKSKLAELIELNQEHSEEFAALVEDAL